MIKNIIIICDYAYIEGGASKVAIQTALALSRQTNLKIFFLTGYGEICDDLKNSNVIVKSLNMYDLLRNPNRLEAMINGIYNKKAEKELKKLLLTMNIEETVVHIHTWTKVLSSSIFKVCNDIGVKTFLTVHDYFLTCPNGACYNYVKKEICEVQPMSFKCIKCNCDSRNYFHKIWRCIRQLIQKKIISKFEKLNYIFISEYQREQIYRRYNYVQKNFLVKNIIEIKDNFKVNCESNNYFSFMGRVCKEKGITLFCEAVRKAKVPGLVIGDGPLFSELKEQYKEINFVGWQDRNQILKWLKKTRALIFPTLWYEGSPLTIPEVQAHGIPCIVTDCSSAIDDIIERKNGEITKCNIDDIVIAITRFKDDKYIKKLSENTYKMFDQNRGSEKWYVNNLIETYMKG